MDKAHQSIRSIREELGLSQQDMAEKMGVDRTTYINFEHGRTRLVDPKLEKFLEVTNRSLGQILSEEYGSRRSLTRGYLSEDTIGERLDALSEDIAELKAMVSTLILEGGR